MKKWKIFLSIFVLVLVAGGGTLYYFLNVKEYKTADKKVEGIVKSEYDIQLPDDNSIGISTQVQAKADPSPTNQTAEKAGSATGSVTVAAGKPGAVTSRKNSQPTDVVKPKRQTAAEILAKYQPVFEKLESQADEKLNNLLSYAISEYQTKRSNGEDISYFYFYSKYTSAANNLENSTDTTFYYIYNVLVKDLENSGYSTKAAEPIKSHYLSVKKQRRNAIMNQAMSHVN